MGAGTAMTVVAKARKAVGITDFIVGGVLMIEGV
jgi:hypothetical protein